MNDLFMVVKPSGSIYLKEIEHILNLNQFLISERYYDDNWKQTAEELYYKNFVNKLTDENEAYEDFLVHAWVNNILYGNVSIVLLLKDLMDLPYAESVKRVFKVKQEIRNSHPETRNGTCLIAVNLKKLNLALPQHRENGRIVICSKDGNINDFDQLTNELGRWKGYFLHFVHCPDPTPEDFQTEMKILAKMGIFNSHNLITPENWELHKKAGSCQRL